MNESRWFWVKFGTVAGIFAACGFGAVSALSGAPIQVPWWILAVLCISALIGLMLFSSRRAGADEGDSLWALITFVLTFTGVFVLIGIAWYISVLIPIVLIVLQVGAMTFKAALSRKG